MNDRLMDYSLATIWKKESREEMWVFLNVHYKVAVPHQGHTAIPCAAVYPFLEHLEETKIVMNYQIRRDSTFVFPSLFYTRLIREMRQSESDEAKETATQLRERRVRSVRDKRVSIFLEPIVWIAWHIRTVEKWQRNHFRSLKTFVAFSDSLKQWIFSRRSTCSCRLWNATIGQLFYLKSPFPQIVNCWALLEHELRWFQFRKGLGQVNECMYQVFDRHREPVSTCDHNTKYDTGI